MFIGSMPQRWSWQCRSCTRCRVSWRRWWDLSGVACTANRITTRTLWWQASWWRWRSAWKGNSNFLVNIVTNEGRHVMASELCSLPVSFRWRWITVRSSVTSQRRCGSLTWWSGIDWWWWSFRFFRSSRRLHWTWTTFHWRLGSWITSSRYGRIVHLFVRFLHHFASIVFDLLLHCPATLQTSLARFQFVLILYRLQFNFAQFHTFLLIEITIVFAVFETVKTVVRYRWNGRWIGYHRLQCVPFACGYRLSLHLIRIDRFPFWRNESTADHVRFGSIQWNAIDVFVDWNSV